MDIAKEIRKILVEEELTFTELAEKLETSQQNLSSKIKRNNFSVNEMLKIAECLGYDLSIEFHKKQ